MAALALVLGNLSYRPSPFCLLDEVDAPLDEANVGRFTEKIREMAAAHSLSSSRTTSARWKWRALSTADDGRGGNLKTRLGKIRVRLQPNYLRA